MCSRHRHRHPRHRDSRAEERNLFFFFGRRSEDGAQLMERAPRRLLAALDDSIGVHHGDPEVLEVFADLDDASVW